jgi:MFS family permease
MEEAKTRSSFRDHLTESQLEGGEFSADREGKQESANHHIVVCTSGEDDAIDPRNWSLPSRCKNIAILSFLIFVQAWAGAAASMANSVASMEFHVSKVSENLSTAMYLLGIGSGALFVGPLSETVGRNPTYLTATSFYLLFVLGSALTPTFGGQVVCRFFVGLFASATLAINGSSVRDQFRPVKRAFVFPIVAWANVAGKVAPHWWIYLLTSLIFLYGCSSCYSTYSRWLHSVKPPPRLALD